MKKKKVDEKKKKKRKNSCMYVFACKVLADSLATGSRRPSVPHVPTTVSDFASVRGRLEGAAYATGLINATEAGQSAGSSSSSSSLGRGSGEVSALARARVRVLCHEGRGSRSRTPDLLPAPSDR